MENDYVTTLIRLALALVAGGLIGLERTYHGRPAGFRTHTLVCTASGLLMLLPVFYERLIPGAPVEVIRLDPTRMAQGIMTGIGFLGAGVIFKEGLAIRGLTTAASIWMTASIGIMIGMGLYFAALLAEIISLGTLSVFRWMEAKVPSLEYARLRVGFNQAADVSEEGLTRIFDAHGLTSTSPSYQMENQIVQYEVTIRTRETANFQQLAETLRGIEGVVDFSIVPTGG